MDIANNCLQSLFWLSVAHGLEVNTITVEQEFSEKRVIIERSTADNNRIVLDVAGLWTAYYYSHNPARFYPQLALIQFDIEKHSVESKRPLEFYYRRHFGNAVLRYNRLRIYLPQHDDNDKDPRLRAAKWAMDVVLGLIPFFIQAFRYR